jgi:hypothetical protein
MLPEPTLGSYDCANAGAAMTDARATAAINFFMTHLPFWLVRAIGVRIADARIVSHRGRTTM